MYSFIHVTQLLQLCLHFTNFYKYSFFLQSQSTFELSYFTSLPVQVYMYRLISFALLKMEYFLGHNSQTTCIIQPLPASGQALPVVHSAVWDETLYFPVIMSGNYQQSMFDTYCSSLWSTNPKTKQTEYVPVHLIKEVKLDFEKNHISNAVCLFTLTNDTEAVGPDFYTNCSQRAFGRTSQRTSETASYYQRNSEPWQIIPYYFLKENTESVLRVLQRLKSSLLVEALPAQSNSCTTGPFLSSLNCVLGP